MQKFTLEMTPRQIEIISGAVMALRLEVEAMMNGFNSQLQEQQKKTVKPNGKTDGPSASPSDLRSSIPRNAHQTRGSVTPS